LLSILILYFVVPDPVTTSHHSDSEVTPKMFADILRHGSLLRLDAGVLLLHASLTALFVVLPLVLADKNLDLLAMPDQWMLYLPVMLLSFVLMIPLIIVAEAKRKMKQVFVLSIVFLISACVMLAMGHASIIWIGIALLIFFTGFNTLEASLPSLVAKYAPAGAKGTAIGVFNTSQFFGAFLGGLLGGLMYHPDIQNYAMVFWVVAGMLCIWLLIALSMQQPPYLASRSYAVKLNNHDDAKALEDRLLSINGVAEALVVLEESTIYFKVDSKVVDEKEVFKVLKHN
jgi:predicted MFS family arabinose efflux permease